MDRLKQRKKCYTRETREKFLFGDLDRIRRAVKKHRDREKLVERERETRRRLHVSVSIRKKDRGRRTGQVGKEA